MDIKQLIQEEWGRIDESLSQTIYHYTGIDTIIKILQTGKAHLSSSLGTDSDNYGTKPFFLSTTRTPSLEVGYANSGGRQSRLVLDGGKLNHNFKGKPVDYWQRKDPNDPIYSGMHPEDKKHRQNRDFEYEDRIYSDKPYIENFIQYVKGIDILTTPEIVKEHAARFNALKVEAAKRSIPFGVYLNKGDFARRQNSVTDAITSNDPHEPYQRLDFNISALHEMFALILYNEEFIKNYDSFKTHFEKYVVDNKLEPLNLNAFKIHDMMRSGMYNRDFLSGLKANLHNTFKSGNDNNLRKHIHFLTDEMRRNRVNSIDDLYKVKVKGLNVNRDKKDYSKTVQLAYNTPNSDTNENFTLIPNDTPLDKVYGLYFNVWKYGGQLDEKDFEIYYNMKQNGQPLGEFINYMYNKYVPKKAAEIFNNSIDKDRVFFLRNQ